MDYYNEIKNKLIDNEIYQKTKDYSKEKNRIDTYYTVGRLLNDAGKHYGDDIIGQLAIKLSKEVGKVYNKKLLFKMRQLYYLFTNEKVAPVVRQLSWSQCLVLFAVKDIDAINYYASQVILRNLTKRQLQDIVHREEYSRLDKDTKSKLITQEKFVVNDFVKDPIIINTYNNYKEITEKILKRIILEDLDNFLMELGTGFSYVKSEYKIRLGDRYNYIDLLLYNIVYKCYVVIELKTTELKKEHIGQIQAYINYLDKNIKSNKETKTIGIIICKKDNKFVMEYCSDNRICETTYVLNTV